VIEEGLERCPLYPAPLEPVTEQGEGTSPPPGETRSAVEASKPLTPLRLWEIVSLFAGTSVLDFVADFVYSMTNTWARYPLVAIIFLRAAEALLILLHRHRLLLLVTETAKCRPVSTRLGDCTQPLPRRRVPVDLVPSGLRLYSAPVWTPVLHPV
jgi:hypothetical protein